MTGNNINSRIVGGVSLLAIRHEHPRKPGAIYWTARVEANARDFPQTYDSRPAMWDELDRVAKMRGERWRGLDCGMT